MVHEVKVLLFMKSLENKCKIDVKGVLEYISLEEFMKWLYVTM